MAEPTRLIVDDEPGTRDMVVEDLRIVSLEAVLAKSGCLGNIAP